MTIKFKATKHFLPFLIASIVLGAVILFLILISIDYHPRPQAIGRGIPVVSGCIIGLLIYLAMIKIIKIFFTKEYDMELGQNSIEIKSGQNCESIDYNNINTFIIYNNGEYARIKINTKTKVYKYYIGFANLTFGKNKFAILQSFDTIDDVFAKNNFKKKMIDKNATDKLHLYMIEYRRQQTIL